MKLSRALEKTAHRLAALYDGSAWFLIAPAVIALWLLDPPMAKSLGTWSVYFLVLVGGAVMISRIAFPQIKLAEFVDRSFDGSVACAIVTFAVILFVALVMFAAVLWARPVGA